MEIVKQYIDGETLRELTEKYRGRKIIFQKVEKNKQVRWERYGDFVNKGVISHAVTLTVFAVEFRNILKTVHLENFKFVD